MSSDQLDILKYYSKGVKIFFQDNEHGWIQATIDNKTIDEAKSSIVLTCLNATGGKLEFSSTFQQILDSKNAILPPLCNPPMLDGIDDLSNLSHLHEPAVLHNLRVRYEMGNIYTYSGIVLVAMNPFARVQLYSQDILEAYAGQVRGELEPHLFAIAEDAYQGMVRDNRNQTIIVSGESGAGKTVSAKYIMRYFASAHEDSRDSVRGESGVISYIEEMILATNPVLESFGNAKTTRNDNSSRFGKYLEIEFNKANNITGAFIRTYLLERSRLVYQPLKERNYHIFYQLVAALPDQQRQSLGLKSSWKNYTYTNQGGGNTGIISGVDDAKEFQATCESLQLIGVKSDQQWDIFKILAALLHVGEIQFKEVGRSGSSVEEGDSGIDQVVQLLQIDTAELKKCLTKKQITMRSEKIISNLSRAQSIVARDSMAKFIYSHIFDWLVVVINAALKANCENDSRFIGVLDIYGFEHFEKNSFEQFCINYANEKLQQHFNRHVFKLEQEEYQREQLQNWTFIDFNDNQNCIELIEGRFGIMGILDEESRLQQGTDETTLTKLYNQFAPDKPGAKKKVHDMDSKKETPSDYFARPRIMKPEFSVFHYANCVTYSIEGFVEKNRDTVSDEMQNLLRSSKFTFFTKIIEDPEPEEVVEQPKSRRIDSNPKKPTLGTVFKKSLIDLMKTIENTDSHYIRCIKPNEAKTAWGFDGVMVLSQLRACGVLETIRISCAGYPSRLTKQDFVVRYSILYTNIRNETDIDDAAKILMRNILKDESLYQIGLTKVFFRAGILAQLERNRTERLDKSALMLQKNYRRMKQRRIYLKLRNATITLQYSVKSFLAKKELQKKIKEKAVSRIQHLCRHYIACSLVNTKKSAVLKIQALAKSYLCYKNYRNLLINSKAVKIQSLFRGYISYKLEGKVVELTRQLQSQEEKSQMLLEKSSALEIDVGKWRLKYDDMVSNNAQMKEEFETQYAAQIENLKDKLDTAQSELEATREQIETTRKELEESQSNLNLSREELTNSKLEFEKAEKALIETNEKLKEELEQTKQRLVDFESAMIAERAEDGGTTRRMMRRSTILVPTALKRGEPRKWEAAASYSTGYENAEYSKLASPPEMSINRRPSLTLPVVAGSRQYPNGLTPTSTFESNELIYNHRRNSFGGSKRSTSIDQIFEKGFKTEDNKGNNPANENKQRTKGVLEQLKNDLKRSTISGADMQNYAKLLARMGESEIGFDEDFILRSEDEVRAMLESDDGLFSEILNELISNLEVPIPNLDIEYTPPELLFPAHLIGLCVIKMFQFNLSKRIDKLLVSCISLIQKKTMTFESDFSAAFWLSNVFELLSIVKTSMTERKATGYEYVESERAMTEGMQFLESLLSDIYFGWAKNLQRRFIKLIIPGVVESEELPGFTANDSSFFNRIIGSVNKESVVKIEHILNFFNNVWKIMEFYYVDVAIMNQVMSELLCTIGVTAFNNIIMRRNFCSWKRGMQIQYNLTRIEEWCKSHDVSDHTGNLDRLLQLVKLLQLQKSTEQDIEIMFEVCDLLNPAQIKKILTIYTVSDYESPILGPLMPEINRRAALTEKTDKILLDTNDMNDQVLYLTARKVSVIETLIPSDLRLFRLRALVESQTDEDNASSGNIQKTYTVES
ncbi:hypothetical protein BB561_001576 [Smittium simulii]|uniref:Myosin motor domain-containing protein n=1 Tax=Smittium simulii TaxID=133385 RepID=A0A2T9YU02_9FUNG|nr:hypothetical protein BB561_001576 [Smittium simulii]